MEDAEEMWKWRGGREVDREVGQFDERAGRRAMVRACGPRRHLCDTPFQKQNTHFPAYCSRTARSTLPVSVSEDRVDER